MSNIYISYAHGDRFFALKLRQDLINAGGAAVLDRSILRAGDPYERILKNAIDKARVIVVILSVKSANSAGVREEVEYAISQNKHIIPLLMDGDYSIVDHFGLSDRYVPQIETPEIYAKVIADIVDLSKPDLTRIIESLHEQGFELEFTNMFRRLINHPGAQDSLILYYAGNPWLHKVVNVERAINRIAKTLTESSQFRDIVRPLEKEQPVFVVSSYAHPSSTEIILALSQAASELISDPTVRDILIGMVSAALYGMVKEIPRRGAELVFAAKQDEAGEWNQAHEENELAVYRETTHRHTEEIEIITEDSRFFGLRGGGFVWGQQKRTRKRTTSENRR